MICCATSLPSRSALRDDSDRIRTASQALADLSSVVGFFREAVARREAGPRIVPVPIHKLTG